MIDEKNGLVIVMTDILNKEIWIEAENLYPVDLFASPLIFL